MRWRVPAAGVVTALLLIGVYFVGFRQPGSAEIAEMVAETEQLQAQQASLTREIGGLEEVASRQDELNPALQLLERLVPSGLAQPALLVELQTAAGAAGVDLVSVTFGDPEIPEGAPAGSAPGTVLVAMPVTVVTDGSFFGITDLLRRVEVDVDRAVLVGTVALTEAEAGFPRLQGTWSGQAYALIAADDPLLVDPDAPPVEPAPTTEPPPGGPTPPAPTGGTP